MTKIDKMTDTEVTNTEVTKIDEMTKTNEIGVNTKTNTKTKIKANKTNKTGEKRREERQRIV